METMRRILRTVEILSMNVSTNSWGTAGLKHTVVHTKKGATKTGLGEAFVVSLAGSKTKSNHTGWSTHKRS